MTVTPLATVAAPALRRASSGRPPGRIAWYVGDLRTGRISTQLPVDAGSWTRELDAAGTLSGAQIAGPVVRRVGARRTAAAAKCFLACTYNDRVMQAGPIWSHSWSWEDQQLTLGAGGLWSVFDHRLVLPVLAAGQAVQTADTTVVGRSLGGIARALVGQALTHTGGDLPVVLPDDEPGTRTETFRGYELPVIGEQLRQLTQRETAAPNIRFQPRWNATHDGIEWVMQVGTEAAPQLVQPGPDWVFDATSRRSPVAGIGVDLDGGDFGFRGWVTGDGADQTTPIGTAYDGTLVDAGYPLLEVKTSRSSKVQAELDARALQLVTRQGRPVETWRAVVHASAASEVAEGDYAQLVTKGDAYLPDGSYRTRVLKVSGDLTDFLTLDLAPTLAVV